MDFLLILLPAGSCDETIFWPSPVQMGGGSKQLVLIQALGGLAGLLPTLGIFIPIHINNGRLAFSEIFYKRFKIFIT